MARPRRIPHYDYTGVQRYFITTCTLDRTPCCTDQAVVGLIVDAFLQTATEHAFTIVVYCVMPDHIHLLLDGDHDGADLKTFMKVAKQRAGFQFKKHTGRRLWQEGYYEHVLRDVEKTEDVIRYIINNPIRKGLVANPLDYPYWGSTRFSREELLHSIGLRRT